MGLVPVASGSISLGGRNLAGLGPAEIARLGIGYVPQGRRLWKSLTVDEHLKLVAQRGGAWTPERVYSVFPRACRTAQQRRCPTVWWRTADAGHWSGAFVESETSRHGRADGRPGTGHCQPGCRDVGPFGAGRRHRRSGHRTEYRGGLCWWPMKWQSWSMARSTGSCRRRNCPRIGICNRRCWVSADMPIDETPDPSTGPVGSETVRRHAPSVARIYLSNPQVPTRWTQPVPVRVIESSGPHRVAGRTAFGNSYAAVSHRRQWRPGRRSMWPGRSTPKGEELRYIRDILKDENLTVCLVDLSTSGKPSGAEVPPHVVAAFPPARREWRFHR